MSELKVRMRCGDREFEIEGAADAVERQLESLRYVLAPELRSQIAKETPLLETEPPAVRSSPPQAAPPVPIEKILSVQGRVCSLTVGARVDDAVLTILLGQRRFRQNDAVSGSEIMAGLRESQIRVQRVDALMEKHMRAGVVVSTGRYRRRRYRLSADGIRRAEQIAQTLIGKLPPAAAAVV
jgi:hypothetical protein